MGERDVLADRLKKTADRMRDAADSFIYAMRWADDEQLKALSCYQKLTYTIENFVREMGNRVEEAGGDG